MKRLYIQQLIEFLLVIRKSVDHRIDLNTLQQRLQSLPIYGLHPPFDYMVSIAVDMDFLVIQGDYAILTPVAKSLVGVGIESSDLLVKEKRSFLASCCLSAKGALGKQLHRFLAKMRRSSVSRCLILDVRSIEESEYDLVGMLLSSGILSEIEGKVFVTETFNDRVSTLLNSQSSHLALADLKLLLNRNEEIGSKAEGLVIEFERSRLRGKGRKLEAMLVRQVSVEDVKAGYDIVSFDGNETAIEHDRFIEVKGSAGSSLSFFLTRNELLSAERLGKQYWLYFVCNVDSKRKRKIYVIQNLHLFLANSIQVKSEPVCWHITGELDRNWLSV